MSANSLLSIDVGRGNLHIVEGNYSKGTVNIDKTVIIRIPDRCFNGGAVENKELFIATLSDIIRNHGFISKTAVVTVNDFDAIVREISLPVAKPKEIASMIKNELVQTYHAEPEDIIQFKTIDKGVNEQGNTMNKYRAAALDPDMVDTYHEIITGAKLKPLAMDLNFNAMDKLLSGSMTVNNRILNGNATMFLDYGESLTTAYIVSPGKPIFHRHINVGCGEIERHIHEETFASEEEIRKMKEEGYNFFNKDSEGDKYYMILRPYFYHLADEIRKIIEFYTSRPNAASVDQVFLFGGGSILVGFSDYCEHNFNIPTEKIEVLSNVKFKNPETLVAPFTNAIGALIRL